jgi:hypothetical protein
MWDGHDTATAQGRAGARVATAHHRGAGVAGRVQPGDRRAVVAQHPGPLVGAQPTLRPQVAGHQRERQERRPGQSAQARVRPLPRVTVVAVVRRIAPPEVLVPPARRESVEPLHRRPQRLTRHADPPGQPVQGAGPVRDPGVEPAPGQRGSRRPPGEQIPVPVGAVGDQPRRQVRAATGAAQHGVHHVDVRGGLVHEPPPGAVDHQAARQVPLGQAEVRPTGQRQRRPPPRLVHQVQRRPQPLPLLDAQPGVPGRADGPRGAQVLVLTAHPLVVVEPAARQHHPAPGPQQHVAGDDPGDPAVLDVQGGHRRTQAHRDPRRAQPGPQPGGQCLPHGEPPPPEPARSQLDRGQCRPWMAQPERQPSVVDRGHRHPVRRRPVRRGERAGLLGDPADVQRARLQCAALGQPARRLGVIVRIARHPGELQRCVLFDERQHRGPVLEQGVPPVRRHLVACNVFQIGGRLRSGYPQAPAGAGGRATIRLGAVHHDSAEPLVCGGERGGHPGRAAAHHDDVEFLFAQH